MTVYCKVQMCPYNSPSGFCRNKLVSITPNGNCGHIYTEQGVVKQNWQEKIDKEFMQGYRKNEEE